MKTKQCTLCKKYLPLTEYGSHIRGKNGKKSRCKKCLSKLSREYFKLNREAILAKNRARGNKNKIKYRETCKIWREKNKERCLVWQKNWRDNNLDTIRRYKRLRYRLGLSKIGKCAYCGRKTKLQIDHKLAISRGGTDDLNNISFVCTNCNSRKYNKTIPEFIKHAKHMEYKLIINSKSY